MKVIDDVEAGIKYNDAGTGGKRSVRENDLNGDKDLKYVWRIFYLNKLVL